MLHRVPGNPQTRLEAIPGGRSGTRATLRLMSRLVRDSAEDYELIAFARSLIAHLPPKAWRAEACAIFYFVRDRIRYVQDPVGLESIAGPLETLRVGQGDCDDKSVLAVSLLQAIGHPARFLAVGFDGEPLSHVLVETYIADRWVPMELTENLPFGEYPERDRITSTMVEHL